MRSARSDRRCLFQHRRRGRERGYTIVVTEVRLSIGSLIVPRTPGAAAAPVPPSRCCLTHHSIRVTVGLRIPQSITVGTGCPGDAAEGFSGRCLRGVGVAGSGWTFVVFALVVVGVRFGSPYELREAVVCVIGVWAARRSRMSCPVCQRGVTSRLANRLGRERLVRVATSHLGGHGAGRWGPRCP